MGGLPGHASSDAVNKSHMSHSPVGLGGQPPGADFLTDRRGHFRGSDPLGFPYVAWCGALSCNETVIRHLVWDFSTACL